MEEGNILSRFKNEVGEYAGPQLVLPRRTTIEHLRQICNGLLEQDQSVPYTFYVNEIELTETLGKFVDAQSLDTEKVLEITYQPQAVFYVRPVTRCTSSLPGHSDAVLTTSFSPDGGFLASGSGDKTVRFWDINTETPIHVCESHPNWVLSVAWSPDGKKLASGCKSGQICIWNPETGKQIGRNCVGHRQWINGIVWEPLHRDGNARKLASASKDCTIRIWDTIHCQTIVVLSGHTQSVTCIRWGGTGLIYSASQDRTIRVWRSDDGILCRILQGHGHWVNTLALNTDYVMRTGAIDPQFIDINHSKGHEEADELQQKALVRYNAVRDRGPERMVSGSDDFTMHLWQPEESKQPITRMTGHQQLVNDVRFSPDGRLVASASFDKSIRLWNGVNGKFMARLLGHVQAVYRIAWSADSRLLVSGSADSTLKVWDVMTNDKKKLMVDLPGHADQVYSVDWSPDGHRVVSGGKDKVLKIWRN